MTYSTNSLVENLIRLSAERTLEEKWLLAPSRRIGMQWLDRVAAAGRPVLNFRVKTPTSFALELASPLMAERRLSLASRVRAQIIAARVFEKVSNREGGYFVGLKPGPGIAEAVRRTLEDLRLAGVDPAGLEGSDFEVEGKGRDIRGMLEAYERELESARLVDHAGAVMLAEKRLESGAPFADGTVVVVTTADVLEEAGFLERRLLEAVPASLLVILDVDRPRDERPGPASGASLLSYISSPESAPPPPKPDGTANIYRAVGEINEVREVLRRCLEQGVPLDDVELLHTDRDTYVPLIYETFCRLTPDDPAELPVTFYEGIPTSYFRPARALLGWLAWTTGGHPQEVLVRMLSDGLIEIPPVDGGGLSFARLGAALRAVPIGGGRERYLPLIDRELRAHLLRQAQGVSRAGDADEEDWTGRDAGSGGTDASKRALEAVRKVVESLMGLETVPGSRQLSLIESARRLLEGLARRADRFDEYCARRLLDDIEELRLCLGEGEVPGFDPASWLAALPRSSFIEGKGPRPGCLYVAPLREGGHSGRSHTFIIGLDDSRFPGTLRQDALLLDSERARVSRELTTGASRLERELSRFAGLMARLRGRVTLGYACRSLEDDREMFPGPPVLQAFRVLVERHGDLDDLARWTGRPTAFFPDSPGACLDTTEWWLERTCAGPGGEVLERSVGEAFPNIKRGLQARAARRSDGFTEYDGYVPEAGADCDLSGTDGPVMSASRLETLARCPLEYFFKYVLEVASPQEYLIDPGVWLEPAQRGELLHATFRKFMGDLKERGHTPEFKRDGPLLRGLLDEEVARWTILRSPPSDVVFEAEKRDLELAARIFLLEEEAHCRGHLPEYFEAAIGLERETGGTALDSDQPVCVELEGGRRVRLRGRLDRVDRVLFSEGDCFTVWDYKTGSPYTLDRADPFGGGRRMQGAVYMELAGARIAEVHPGARVIGFGFFFPGARGRGTRLSWNEAELAPARPVLALLCELVGSGAFLFTDDPDDVRFSDYARAFGGVQAASNDVKRKIADPANVVLRPFMALRGIERCEPPADERFTGEGDGDE